jgi:polar amino acid transport system substrate-binding protein
MKGRRPAIKNRNQLAGVRVGVLDGSPLEEWLQAEKAVKIDSAATQSINARKLQAGRIDAWFVVRQVGLHEFAAEGFDRQELESGLSLRAINLYLAASPDFPALESKKWREAFDLIKKDGTYARIVSKYKIK